MDEEMYKWASVNTLGDGVLVGCNASQEWLLSWWYMNYRMHNEFPITFVDFGDMSETAKEWCLRRGQLKSLSIQIENFVASLDNVPLEQAITWQWREDYDIEQARFAWFKKPFACLQSPFKRTIWMDLDCQVRKSITPIYDYCENDCGFAIAKEHPSQQEKHELDEIIKKGEVEYNSGVFVFKHGIPLIQEWAEMCLAQNSYLRGDQETLSLLIFNKKLHISTLPFEYNTRYHIQEENDPTIIHWLGMGQEIIKDLISFLEGKCFMNFSLNKK